MTPHLFRAWLCDVDALVAAQNRKIIMFLDRCAAHDIEGLHFQNMEQGIISQVKEIYRRQLVQYLVRGMECSIDVSKLKWDILQAMQRLCIAWEELNPASILNCFRKAGLVHDIKGNLTLSISKEDETTTDADVTCDSEDWREITRKLQVQGVTFDDFVLFDNICISHHPIAEDEIILLEEEDDVEPECKIKTVINQPQVREVTEALNTLETFFLTFDISTTISSKLFRESELIVTNEMRKQIRQRTLKE